MAEDFAPLVHGLLRQAGVRQSDRLIGISDGAAWVAELFGDLAVKRHILDVYHASTCFEALMLGLGYSDWQRLQQRKALLRGEINLQQWLNLNLNIPGLDPTHALNEASQKALNFLQIQALLNHSSYPWFKGKIAGAHWAVSGASARAFARSQFFALNPTTGFDALRHVAFPAA